MSLKCRMNNLNTLLCTWKQKIPPKYCCLSNKLHVVPSQYLNPQRVLLKGIPKITDCVPLRYWYQLYKVIILSGDRGSTVVKALYYKSGGHWFDSSWCYWNFSLT